MPILRGHTFQPTEFVTANSLHELVESASITELTTDEFTGEIHGLATATPVSVREGDLLFLHETSASMHFPIGITPWSNPNYLVHYKGQWISLFGADHLETGRFFNNVGGAHLDPGEHCQFAALSGSGGATLTLAINATATGKAMCVGSAHVTAADGAVVRIRMIGFGLFNGAANSAGAVWLDTLHHGSADSQWVKSTASDDSGFNALRLNTNSSGSGAQNTQPAYLFGGLNFRQ